MMKLNRIGKYLLLFKIMHWPGGIFLIIFGAMILIATFVLWSMSFRKEVRLRLATDEKLREALKEIEKKHRIIEEKNTEIADSITFDWRIRQANTHVPESFVYYQRCVRHRHPPLIGVFLL